MDTNQLEKILRMTQPKLKKYVYSKLKTRYEAVVKGNGFVFAKGEIPILLVAHLDTVHETVPKKLVYSKNCVSSPQGIGGDDRCGVYAILKLIDKCNCSVLFSEDEERGCIGTNLFLETDLAKSLIGQFNYIIELDRKGANDAVFYECDNPDFEEFITKEFFKTNYGSLSDISYLAPHLKCAAVNLSCGYYKQHTKAEYINLKELDTSIKETEKLIKRTKANDAFEYVEREYYAYDYYNYNWYKRRYDTHNNSTTSKSYAREYYIEARDGGDFIIADSIEEAIGIFLIDHPDECFRNLYYEDITAWR